MKRLRFVLVLLAAIAALSLPQATLAQKGEKCFGVKTGYVSRNRSALAGIYFQYAFSDHFRLSPEAEVAFRHKDRDALQLNLDCHVPFVFHEQSKADVYPIAGICYASWNRHYSEAEDDGELKDVSTRKGYFGLNFGAGFDLKASESLKLSLEARYSLVKSNSGVQISLGIGYIF